MEDVDIGGIRGLIHGKRDTTSRWSTCVSVGKSSTVIGTT
jgi:hypothetical protein